MTLIEAWTYFATVFVGMFVIIDPFAVIPVYLTVTDRFSEHDKVVTRRKAALIAASILVAFSLFGMKVFNVFGITLPAFQIAGGILLLRVGLQQLNADRRRVNDEEKSEGLDRDDISVFPLATPLLAGPGAISTVVLYSSDAASWKHGIILVSAILLALVASYLLLKLAPSVLKIMGRTGLNLMTRIMGIILCAISIQFCINGLIGAIKQIQLAL